MAENVFALELAAAAARDEYGRPAGTADDSELYAESRALVLAVLNLSADLGVALRSAFAAGYLDVPYCLHPDNAGRSRSYLDTDGRLRWAVTGSMPLPGRRNARTTDRLTAANLLSGLTYTCRKFDTIAAAVRAAPREHAADLPARSAAALIPGVRPAI
jgi:methylaspartate mutase epsilon subunit